MSSEDVNLDEIERRRDRLFEKYGEAPVRERHDSPSAGEFAEWVETSRAGYVGSAYALIRRPPGRLPDLTESMEVEGEERERVLLIQGRGGRKWGVPGGGQEGSETFEETARREVREEVGIDFEITDLAYVRHEISTHEAFDERLHVLRVFFDGVYEGGHISVQPGELNGAAWLVEPPAEDRLMPSTKRVLEGWEPDHRDW